MKYDVAVVGAGPAGAWTAYLLASRGARVVLADPSHPREKPCGGGVTGRALALVQSALAVDRLPTVSIRTARFVDTATAASATVPLDRGTLTGALVVASRAEFDGLLVAAATRAGAALLTARVTNIEIEHRGVRLDTADGTVERAAWVIGADGANSLVRRRLARPFRRDQLSIATGFFARGVSSDEIVLELVGDPPGYIWSFPRHDHLAIGICTAADAGPTAGALRARVAEWIRIAGIAPDAPLEPYSWPIPTLSPRDFETLDVAGRGWLLAGDAAGLVDPITREGIFFALQSGAFAAETLASGCSRPDRCYNDRVQTQIASDLARAARIKAGFFRPRFTRLLIDALAQSHGIRAVMADLIAGTQSYRGLKWRLTKTFEVGLLWRLLHMGMTRERF
jgi:geranylgeranyl reductase family protein